MIQGDFYPYSFCTREILNLLGIALRFTLDAKFTVLHSTAGPRRVQESCSSSARAEVRVSCPSLKSLFWLRAHMYLHHRQLFGAKEVSFYGVLPEQHQSRVRSQQHAVGVTVRVWEAKLGFSVDARPKHRFGSQRVFNPRSTQIEKHPRGTVVSRARAQFETGWRVLRLTL